MWLPSGIELESLSKCTTELSNLNEFNMAIEQIHQGDKVTASDSVIQGDLFSGTKAETIIINQYGSNPAGRPHQIPYLLFLKKQLKTL